MRANKKSPLKSDKTQAIRGHKRGVVGYSRKTALLEEAITQMNAGRYGRSSAALKELLTLDPNNMEARRLFATLHLRLGSLIPARQAFDELIKEAFERQDYWLAESLLREYLAAGPRCVPYLEKLGALYQEKGDTLEAVAEYGKAIDILIEDPDSDNLHHASELYKKIRGLAPASPVAFRLASFFNPETGELLVRRSNDSGQSTVAPPRDMSERGLGAPTCPEPMDEAMSSEMQDPQSGMPDFLTDADLLNPSESLSGTTTTDLPAPSSETLNEAVSTSDIPSPQQRMSGTSDVCSDVPEGTRTSELGNVSAGAPMDDSPKQGASEHSLPSTFPSEPAVQPLETQLGSPPALSMAGPVMSLQHDTLLADAEPGVSNVSGLSTVSAPQGLSNSQDSPISSEQTIEDAGVAHSSSQMEGIEERAAPVFGETSATGEPKEKDDPLFLSQPVRVDSMGMAAEQCSDTWTPSSPETIAAPEMSEPWKQPGFSWESVFDRAWKFQSDSIAHVSSSEPTQTNVEELPPAVSAAPLQEPAVENQAREILTGEESVSLGDSPSSGSSIAPMPWDHIQESVIAIPEDRIDPLMAESLTLTDDRSPGPTESDSTPKTSGSQVLPSASSESSGTETDAFSMAETSHATVSLEPEISVADGERTAFQTGHASASAEPESEFRVVSDSTRDEPTPLETSSVTIASPVFANGPVAGEVTVSSEVLSRKADPVLNISHDRTTAATQNAVHEAYLGPSELTGRLLDEVPLHSTRPIQPKIEESPPEIVASQHLAETPTEASASTQQPWTMECVEAPTFTPELTPQPMPEQEEGRKAEESIRSIDQSQDALAAQGSQAIFGQQEGNWPMSVASVATAADGIFESSRNVSVAETREQAAKVNPSRKPRLAWSRARLTIAGFVSSCFSTTRAMVMTCVGLVTLAGVFIALGIGAIGLTWIIMEESPSPVFQRLTIVPQRTLSDSKKNGYVLLLGIDAPDGLDPLQVGDDQKREGHGAATCFGGSGSGTIGGADASAKTMRGWVRSSDPVGEFKSHQEIIKGWGNQHQLVLNRYNQWQKLPFEDWGYGQTVHLPCATIGFAHQLHVANGFLQSTDLGIDRLEADMETWRIVLGQARTLAVKTIALQAINDDIAIASGVLVRADFDGKYLGRIAKILRPLDQTELSMRWPMQNELVAASKTYEAQLKAARAKEQPVYAMVASVLPLPMQRRLNDYAEYYDASSKVAGEGRYGSLPKWKDHIRFPASGLMDYLMNPIENIIGLEPLPAWDLSNGLVVDTDAHLRLASLQAWLRRGPADGDLATRIAKAGQNFYDPYTGLPMLMNLKKGAIYSVGHDGKDQDADPQSDVVVEIPVGHTSAAPMKPSASSSKSR